MIRATIFLSILSVFVSCKKDTDTDNTLKSYIEEEDLNVSEQWLIACSAGNANDPNLETSIFFYPVEGACNVKYFESEKEDPNDYGGYEEYSPTRLQEFNGYLERFKREGAVGKWSIITYMVNDSLRISDPIRLKPIDKPTELECDIMRDSITFSWEDGIYKDNVIYFQVISDESNNLLSGTYTTDKFFTYKDYSNVTISIRDESIVPTLEKGKKYTFTLMAVSEDNWVNLFCGTPFEI